MQPFHPDDLKRLKKLSYLRSSAEAYFLLGVKGWKFDHSTLRLTPVFFPTAATARSPSCERCTTASAHATATECLGVVVHS